MKRRVPRMTTDEEAETFLDGDLSDLDFKQFKPVRFRFAAETARHEYTKALAPGTPAPRSGIYQQIGPRGGRRSERVTSARGEPLPATPKDGSWMLIEASERRKHK